MSLNVAVIHSAGTGSLQRVPAIMLMIAVVQMTKGQVIKGQAIEGHTGKGHTFKGQMLEKERAARRPLAVHSP